MMIHKGTMRWMAGLWLAMSVAACAVENAPPADESTPAAAADQDDPAEPTAEAIAALTGQTPSTAAACHGTFNNCTAPVSCRNWSTPQPCNTPTCAASGNSCSFVVQPGPHPIRITYPPLVSGLESFVWCTDFDGKECQQGRTTVVTSCSAAQCCQNCSLIP